MLLLLSVDIMVRIMAFYDFHRYHRTKEKDTDMQGCVKSAKMTEKYFRHFLYYFDIKLES
jgi:hypothetical protein